MIKLILRGKHKQKSIKGRYNYCHWLVFSVGDLLQVAQGGRGRAQGARSGLPGEAEDFLEVVEGEMVAVECDEEQQADFRSRSSC